MKSPETPSSPAPERQAQAIFISRLQRLIRMRKDYRDDLNPLGFRLLDRAIDATYQDCLDFGAGDQARAADLQRHLLERLRADRPRREPT